jgi:hypothetical protein
MSLESTLSYRPIALPRYIFRRGCALAEGRLAYLTELFESGRWRRFHSEIDFLNNIQEAREAVDRWRAFMVDETAIPAVMPWSAAAPVEPEPDFSLSLIYETPLAPPQMAAVEAQPVAWPPLRPEPQRAAVVTPADLNWQRPEPQALGERYPMLRAAM